MANATTKTSTGVVAISHIVSDATAVIGPTNATLTAITRFTMAIGRGAFFMDDGRCSVVSRGAVITVAHSTTAVDLTYATTMANGTVVIATITTMVVNVRPAAVTESGNATSPTDMAISRKHAVATTVVSLSPMDLSSGTATKRAISANVVAATTTTSRVFGQTKTIIHLMAVDEPISLAPKMVDDMVTNVTTVTGVVIGTENLIDAVAAYGSGGISATASPIFMVISVIVVFEMDDVVAVVIGFSAVETAYVIATLAYVNAMVVVDVPCITSRAITTAMTTGSVDATVVVTVVTTPFVKPKSVTTSIACAESTGVTASTNLTAHAHAAIATVESSSYTVDVGVAETVMEPVVVFMALTPSGPTVFGEDGIKTTTAIITKNGTRDGAGGAKVADVITVNATNVAVTIKLVAVSKHEPMVAKQNRHVAVVANGMGAITTVTDTGSIGANYVVTTTDVPIAIVELKREVPIRMAILIVAVTTVSGFMDEPAIVTASRISHAKTA